VLQLGLLQVLCGGGRSDTGSLPELFGQFHRAMSACNGHQYNAALLLGNSYRSCCTYAVTLQCVIKVKQLGKHKISPQAAGG
jgi:hypothetical protein